MDGLTCRYGKLAATGFDKDLVCTYLHLDPNKQAECHTQVRERGRKTKPFKQH